MTLTVRMCEREGEKESRLIWCKKAGVGERERENGIYAAQMSKSDSESFDRLLVTDRAREKGIRCAT